MMKKLILVLFLFLGVLSTGNAISDHATCAAIQTAQANIIDKIFLPKNRSFCVTDKNCVISRAQGLCPTVVNDVTHAGYQIALKDNSYQSLQQMKYKLECRYPMPKCADPGKPVCVNNKCKSSFD